MSLLLSLFEREDVFRRDHVAYRIAPGVAFVGDDRGDIDFRELLAKSGHRSTRLAVDHDIDMPFGLTLGDGRAFECREHRRQAFTGWLVAGCAVGLVGLLATRHQLVHGPLFSGQLTFGSRCNLALGEPGGVVLFRLGFYHHGHKTVILAAQLGALATVDARLVDTRPGFVDKTWDGVLLHCKCRHPPGVNYVGGGDQKAHFGAERHHQRLVNLEQVVLALGGLVVDLILGRGQVAEELDIFTQVFVMPFPLITRDLNIQLGFAGVIDLDQGLSRRYRHQHQNHQRHDRPENLDRGAFVEVCRLLARRATVNEHRPEHRAEHDHADHDADPEDGHVQVKY